MTGLTQPQFDRWQQTDAWLDGGWNVGIFYWNQLADEEMPQDTESKIWTSKCVICFYDSRS